MAHHKRSPQDGEGVGAHQRTMAREGVERMDLNLNHQRHHHCHHHEHCPIDSAPPHFRHTLWWVCGGVWSKCGSLPHLARTMAARACNQTLAPQFNHKTCYLSGGFVVQVWWVCGPTLWWGCGGVVGLYPTTPTPHNGHTCPPTFLMLPSPTFYV